MMITGPTNSEYSIRIYRAVDYDERTTAACKLVRLTPNTNPEERKSLSKEIAVHRILKHRNVLEFIDYLIIEPLAGSPHYPGVYMLLEFAAGGDLFDKIGAPLSFYMLLADLR